VTVILRCRVCGRRKGFAFPDGASWRPVMDDHARWRRDVLGPPQIETCPGSGQPADIVLTDSGCP
jgi:hypothetical protein